MNEDSVLVHFRIPFFYGDLNYRLDISHEETLHLIKEKMIEKLLLDDQLLNEKEKNKIFAGFFEPKIQFLPTFKFDKGTSNYDTSQKKRMPPR